MPNMPSPPTVNSPGFSLSKNYPDTYNYSMTKIIGICLIKNEDRFIESALQRVLNFCDNIVVLDNNSTDGTYAILQKIQKACPDKIQLHSISNALDSHSFIEKYANTNTWIFAIDGDELYDAPRLEIFRKELLSGRYDDYWKIFGNCIHVEKIDPTEKFVYGYMTPPSRSITKLYNFNAIHEWREHTERLHGTRMKFKENFNEDKTFLLHDIYTWGDSPFRCIHMCFVDRSSLSIKNVRFNPLENLKPYFPILNFFRNLSRGKFSLQSSYKLDKYRRGPITKVEYFR